MKRKAFIIDTTEAQNIQAPAVHGILKFQNETFEKERAPSRGPSEPSILTPRD